MDSKWIAFFSQTGTEIVDIAESLQRWPDKIITNERPEHLRKVNTKLLEKEVIYLPNKPTVEDYKRVLPQNSTVTLHGWLRIMPPEICENYKIYNGHPGLITYYPELKGKDPQVRAFEGIKEGKYPTAGAVIHKVVAGVDEGRVIAEEKFNTFQLELDDLFRILRDRSLYMWVIFLKKVL
jgi:folate-dependent phosphoribosylglycinamide formyltransferase PurN